MPDVDALEDDSLSHHWAWEARSLVHLPKALRPLADAARKHRKQVGLGVGVCVGEVEELRWHRQYCVGALCRVGRSTILWINNAHPQPAAGSLQQLPLRVLAGAGEAPCADVFGVAGSCCPC